IVENARGDLPESEFEQKGIVTEKGMAQLRAYLSEIPAERFKIPMKVAEIPRLFTPETFCKLVVRAQHEARAAARGQLRRPSGSCGMGDHFSAVTFVDRVTHLSAGASARGIFTIPARVRDFPSCLVAEAV